MKKIVQILFLLLITHINFAQSITKTKVFIECTKTWLCDFDFLRSELNMVDFVRDRFIADVHVQVNTQFSSSGNEQNTIVFKGQNNYLNQDDTLSYFNESTLSDDDKRKKMVKCVAMGLIKYILHTEVAENIVITYNKPADTDTLNDKTQKDPWNYWIMSLGANGFFDGDANYKSQSIYGYINADRETEKTKTNIGISYNYRKNEFVISDEETVVTENPKLYFYVNLINKLTEHWGYGIFTSYVNSEYSNYDINLRVLPKVEYDMFKYQDFNNQRVVINYGIGIQYNDYHDTTIFYKTKETQLLHDAAIISSFNKPWGNINVGAFYNSYLHDFSKYSLSFSGSVNWNIFKGFKFAIGGSYNITHNLIQLSKQGATRDEVLLQQKQLNSQYNYFFGVGISYQFGSKFSNYINPAFKGLSWGLNF
ncbi:MAG: hypothetical protein A2W99_07565 [Bacteroidetes bacterium GWF2_33_16]|nr:MAG: hypothetical protein A2X00_10515 [Bacteroidetes bacterium GWE2_32_14]OFY03065.1 MAG: hypothetical protein A2W99_07565 [Bacteroidetes bacterium GWF2_33_16]